MKQKDTPLGRKDFFKSNKSNEAQRKNISLSQV